MSVESAAIFFLGDSSTIFDAYFGFGLEGLQF